MPLPPAPELWSRRHQPRRNARIRPRKLPGVKRTGRADALILAKVPGRTVSPSRQEPVVRDVRRSRPKVPGGGTNDTCHTEPHMKFPSSRLLASTLILSLLAGPPTARAGCPGNRRVAVRPAPCAPPAARTVVRQTPCPVIIRPVVGRPGCGNQALAPSIPASAGVSVSAGNWRAINAALRQQGYALHRVGGNFEVHSIAGTQP